MIALFTVAGGRCVAVKVSLVPVVFLFLFSSSLKLQQDAYLHWGSAKPTALLLINRVIDMARELIVKH